CPQVDADASAGLMKRNEQGQVVLASGSYVPSAIAGSTLRERVQEYYRQHPDARPSQPVQQLLFEPPPENRIQLPTSARIEEIPDKPTVRTQNAPAVDDAPKDASKRAHVTVSASETSTPTAPPTVVEHPFRNARDATYAPPLQRNYGVSVSSAKTAQAPPKKNEAAYRSFVPVYDPKHATNVF
ncbi:hypothetical protein BV20DRAFT_909493, partial [Pilatotrama ljubarskyi]